MQVDNFLKTPSLWNSSTVFNPLYGHLIHGERLGFSTEEIFVELKRQFKISEKVLLADDKQIGEVLEKAESLLSEHFKINDVTIYIAGIDSTEDFTNKHLGGVSGYAWPNAIFLYFNPDKSWPHLLLRTALHEFNHCQRYCFTDPYKSFLDWLIFEGLAESFESELTNSNSSSNFEYSRKLAEKYVPQLSQFWNSLPDESHQWFFGDETKNIPIGLGYFVGYYLVERFRKSSPELCWEKLIKIPSQDFIIDLKFNY